MRASYPWRLAVCFMLISGFLANGRSAFGQIDEQASAAAGAAVELSRLEVSGDFDALYGRMHPDSQAIVPEAAIAGWYTDNFLPLGPRPITVTHVEFVSWTWPVNGVTYPETAEVSYSQTFSTSADPVEDVVRLVKSNGVWLWFFGRSQAFVDQQIAIYGDSQLPTASSEEHSVPNVPINEAAPVSQEQSGVQMIGVPQWWVAPYTDGGLETGYLYYGTLVRNTTNHTVLVAVKFRSYASDGTPYAGCDGLNRPETTIAPRESAWITCYLGPVPVSLTGIQVTAKLDGVKPLDDFTMPVEVVESAILIQETTQTQNSYDVSLLLRAPGVNDVDTQLMIRLYDSNGIQLGTCQTPRVIVEPKVAQRVTCSFPILIDIASPQPTNIRAEYRTDGTWRF